MNTRTTHGAREHARAQLDVAEFQPHLPAYAWASAPEGVRQDSLTWTETVSGGGYTHKVLAVGTHVRLTDLHGDACAHVLLYNAFNTAERLNVADTVKVAWQAYLGVHSLLLSDQGRVLATVVADSSGHHDAFFGTSTAARNAGKYGDGSARGGAPAGRELFKLAAAKNGLTVRDIAPSVSFFAGVRVHGGRPEFLGHAGAGKSVTLRLEMPAIILIANVPHPLDPRPEYHSTGLEVLAWRGQPTSEHDPLWAATPEGERAFLNTASYLAGSAGFASFAARS